MECVEAALKTSFRKEMAMKTNPQAWVEDFCVLNVQNGGEDFFVDDLFDFSNQDDDVVEEQVQEEDEDKVVCVSVSPHMDTQRHGISQPGSALCVKEDFGYLPTGGELSIPADELADLEWLSHFVEDSFSEHSAAYVAGNLTEKPKHHHAIAEDKGPEPEPEPVNNSTKSFFKSPVPAKARSKRARTGIRVCLLGSPYLNESSTSSASSSSSSSPPGPWFVYPSTTTQSHEPVSSSEDAKLPPKKPRKKTVPDWSGTRHGGGSSQAPRRCSHCGVQKTPQWRAGPLGAKTLCNACGVRFKSGRLFPEYRPACSPSFSSELHSNHHRKVLEMRRKKDVPSGLESNLTAPVVRSC